MIKVIINDSLIIHTVVNSATRIHLSFELIIKRHTHRDYPNKSASSERVQPPEAKHRIHSEMNFSRVNPLLCVFIYKDALAAHAIRY